MRRLLTVAVGVGVCAYAFAAHAETRVFATGASDSWYKFDKSSEAGRGSAATKPASRTRSAKRRTRSSRTAARSGRKTGGSFLRRGAASTSRACLTPAARGLLNRIEAKFGRVQVVSTCRPGARIAGTGRISRHASGNAVDFQAGGKKAQVVRWLMANHRAGGIMTYAGMSHIHVDIGPRFVALNHGRRARNRRVASR
jgi:hypothetical protein